MERSRVQSRSGGSGGRISDHGQLFFPHPFQPRVTAVARKRSRSSAQRADGRLQPNAHPHPTNVASNDITL